MARDHPWGDILKIQNSFYLSIVKEVIMLVYITTSYK